MKYTIHQAGTSWNLKSEIYAKAANPKKELSYENTLNLFMKLLFRAVILAIGVAAVTGFIVEISSLF